MQAVWRHDASRCHVAHAGRRTAPAHPRHQLRRSASGAHLEPMISSLLLPCSHDLAPTSDTIGLCSRRCPNIWCECGKRHICNLCTDRLCVCPGCYRSCHGFGHTCSTEHSPSAGVKAVASPSPAGAAQPVDAHICSCLGPASPRPAHAAAHTGPQHTQLPLRRVRQLMFTLRWPGSDQAPRTAVMQPQQLLQQHHPRCVRASALYVRAQ